MNNILIVHTSWYEEHVLKMVNISSEILEKKYACHKAKAPGVIELAALAKNKIQHNKFVGIIFLGIVMRGQTSHYDLITQETFRSIGSLAEKYSDISIINNVICVENDDQLNERLVKNTTNNANALINLINEKSQ